eukprot:gnl/Spiro4/15677_TR8427_c0_g1_i1.p1 gnl/Spiro4/15677_TR8427_c0_g1~~gnl/Spiro4/15677_TR8427_c0_g1_i1.p1  ORF type:complete len:229 (+),score=57.62 gnl/Spiro4/15677_TR8427_c0_g1_i1:39-725(+)
MHRLPSDVQFSILSFLPAADLCRAQCVCREWRQLAATNILWKDRVARDLQDIDHPPAACERPAKELYRELFVDACTFRRGISDRLLDAHCASVAGHSLAALAVPAIVAILVMLFLHCDGVSFNPHSGDAVVDLIISCVLPLVLLISEFFLQALGMLLSPWLDSDNYSLKDHKSTTVFLGSLLLSGVIAVSVALYLVVLSARYEMRRRSAHEARCATLRARLTGRGPCS